MRVTEVPNKVLVIMMGIAVIFAISAIFIGVQVVNSITNNHTEPSEYESYITDLNKYGGEVILTSSEAVTITLSDVYNEPNITHTIRMHVEIRGSHMAVITDTEDFYHQTMISVTNTSTRLIPMEDIESISIGPDIKILGA